MPATRSTRSSAHRMAAASGAQVKDAAPKAVRARRGEHAPGATPAAVASQGRRQQPVRRLKRTNVKDNNESKSEEDDDEEQQEEQEGSEKEQEEEEIEEDDSSNNEAGSEPEGKPSKKAKGAVAEGCSSGNNDDDDDGDDDADGGGNDDDDDHDDDDHDDDHDDDDHDDDHDHDDDDDDDDHDDDDDDNDEDDDSDRRDIGAQDDGSQGDEDGYAAIVARLESKGLQGLSGFANDGDGEDNDDDDSDNNEEEESSEEDDADEEETELERTVLGNIGQSLQLKDSLQPLLSKKRPRGILRNQQLKGESLFFVDTGADDEVEKDEDVEAEGVESDEPAGAARSAWVDEDDAKLNIRISKVARLRKLRKTQDEDEVSAGEYAARLRAQRSKLVAAAPDWASKSTKSAKKKGEKESLSEEQNESEAEEADLLRSSEAYTKSPKSFHVLPPGKIYLSRLHDANQQGPSKAVIQSTDWHKNGQLLATAGMDKTLRLFQVDGKVNHKVESVYLKDMPIWNVRFAGRFHEQAWCVGRRPFFYWMDLESGSVGKVPGIMGRTERSLESMTVAPDGSVVAFCGYDGNLIFVSQQTKQFMHTLKMNENASCAAFSQDGLTMFSSGDKGSVYCWDMRMRRLRFRFKDQGSTASRSIALSNNGKRIAVGSTNGVVNLYDVATTQNEVFAQSNINPEPLKAIMNLTTPVDHVTFNHDGQLLAMLSRRKKDALRLFNVNTLSVVPNWPTSGTPIHYGSTVAFSPSSNALVIGNDRGRCLLYRLHHFSHAAS